MTIDPSLRETLNELAPKRYQAKKQGDSEQASEIAGEIGLDTMGWDCIGNGGGRDVYDMEVLGHPGLVLKLASPHPQWDGQQQNAREVKLWNTLDNEQREFLAPVLAHGSQNYWLVMPKGESVSSIPYEWRLDCRAALGDFVWDEDISEENVVSINGKTKLCDYGTSEQ